MIPRRMHCPCCGARMKLTSSHTQCTELRDQYARCNNHLCGASYLIRWQIDKVVSPPSKIFSQRVKHISGFNHSDRFIDLAVEYVSRKPFTEPQRDHLLSSCAHYLCQLQNDLSENEAKMIAAHAIAQVESQSAEAKGFTICVEDCSTVACVVGDMDGNKHIVSLNELRNFIKKRLNVAL